MKILFITAGVLPIPVTKGGAVETLIEYIIDKNEEKSEIEIDVISCFEKMAFEKSKKYKQTKFYFCNRNLKIQSLLRVINKVFCKLGINKFRNIEDIFYLNQIKNIVKENNYDKIIVENRSSYINYLIKYTNSSLYLHLHNDYLNKKTLLSKEIFDNCDGILTVSEYIKRQVETIEKNDEKIKVLRNCINTELFDKEKHQKKRLEIRRKLKIENDDLVFLYSGRIVKEKGIKELLLAFDKIKNEKVKLLLLGSSNYGNNNKNMYQIDVENLAINLRDKVVFTGFIARDEVAEYHSAADIGVIPSIWEEPACLTVLEAQSSGLPIIATKSGGTAEMVNSKSGILIENNENIVSNLYEAMEYFIKNKNKIQDFGKEGRNNVLKYDANYYYANFIKIIRGF